MSGEEAPSLKRRLSSNVIEISDTDSDDSDVCAVTTYQASADEVKRIRKDYSSSSSSSSSTSRSGSPSTSSSGSSSPCSDEENDEGDRVLELKERGIVERGPLLLRAHRSDEPILNESYKLEPLIQKLESHWKDQNNFSEKDVTLICDPFRVCVLSNFLENSEYINNIVDDMNTLDWNRRKMDLYDFYQTADLSTLTWQRSIRGIYQLLKTDVMSWVSRVTGLELTHVSASCSLYGPGDHLLPHDDLLADRRVAFILYLAPWPTCKTSTRQTHTHNGDQESVSSLCPTSREVSGWSSELGGALELFSRDFAGRPDRVTARLFPANNTMALFKVGAYSYHQVAEVTSLELPRLSINGWFHGPTPTEDTGPLPEPDPEPESHKPHKDTVVLTSWLTSTYMSPRARAQVQIQMEEGSEVSLRDFLQPTKTHDLLAALDDPEVPWERYGPANQRRYQRAPNYWLESLPQENPVRELIKTVTSVAWMRFLADCTDLVCKEYAHCELQRWTPGDYTLLPPREQYQSARLDALLYLGIPGVPGRLSGGSTVYVAPEEGSPALVTVPPISNALSLVYADAGAASFTKYYNKLPAAPTDRFYILTCTYRE